MAPLRHWQTQNDQILGVVIGVCLENCKTLAVRSTSSLGLKIAAYQHLLVMVRWYWYSSCPSQRQVTAVALTIVCCVCQ